MNRLHSLFQRLFGRNSGIDLNPYELNYDKLIHLDAEELAETGIKNAYVVLLSELKHFIPEPAPIHEIIDEESSSYSISAGGRTYEIFSPKIAEVESWGNATFALFDVVNNQLSGTGHRFYAINSGNDLGGMFLTENERNAAISNLPNKKDWPYIPTAESPWFGQAR